MSTADRTFDPVVSRFSGFDLQLIEEGAHFELYRKLGAHPETIAGVAGTQFAVWAPNAQTVSVVGSFNGWDGCEHPMSRVDECGIWELFLPTVGPGELYKFAITPNGSNDSFFKADPYAFKSELRPGTASIVEGLTNTPESRKSIGRRTLLNDTSSPISIYEVHLGSWKRRSAEGNRSLTYGELADELVPYAKSMGFTHLEPLPITEHPFDGSWGYETLGMFAPTSRHGSPQDFRHFVDRCHQEGLGVILDWVPGHFPEDGHGLARFDGTSLYEHPDRRIGWHQEWGTLAYNYGRPEIANFLIASALFWFDQFDVDGLRVDAVTSMLYRDYGRKPGGWLANELGGRENLEAIAFMRRLNHEVTTRFPGAIMIAEEITAWPMVTQPTAVGGLGFSYKWNMDWTRNTSRYVHCDPTQRQYHQSDLTSGLKDKFREKFVLPISHDEVSIGKGSLVQHVSGDQGQRFATLRAYLAFMFAHPGKKLLFMGSEFATTAEWDHDATLDWSLLENPLHGGVQTLIKDLNFLYRNHASLHSLDCDEEGLGWIDDDGEDANIVRFARRAPDNDTHVLVVCNMNSLAQTSCPIGALQHGTYREILNTDSKRYGGDNLINYGLIKTEAGRIGPSLKLTLPPFSTLWLELQPAQLQEREP